MSPDPVTPSSALDWPARSGHSDLLLAELAGRARARRRRRRQAAIAAASLVVAALGAAGFLQPWKSGATRRAVAATEPVTQTLPDGSRVELKDGAQFTTDFSGPFRRVELTRGTAHFQVEKNPSRPFVVTAGGVSVRAVGTAFSVELQRGAVEVLVTEGRVAVEPSVPSAGPAKELATVEAGSGVVLDLVSTPDHAAPAIRSIPSTALEEKLAWRARQLELSGTPLSEVVALLNRHGGGPARRFTIADPEIATVKLSGAIRTDKTAALVHLLEAECHIRAEWREDGEIVLHKAQ